MNLYSHGELQRYSQLLQIKQSLVHVVDASVCIYDAEDADRVIEGITGAVTESCIRIYICQEDGYQISSNFFRGPLGWERSEQYRGSNWIWRPYFISNLLIMDMHKQGILSQVYTDLETSRSIQTFSCVLAEGYYVFLDLQS
ncbi:EAL-associated domain-containing protein [Paenibacillus hexagrammi]|uniref:YkuI C-terminal domain-containing protein n=1 Tax=Paenibacillus hexagrammi TaxID=2908839 RepID=A0ABY3SR15_9BACL|nr:EAL-associated domain-containing protein [Paenibacillus sp. YPD9-1]UJF36518.1 hypothetical protein L0M14_29565 [Paenibacillus sp. YPD9-1]